MAKKKIKTKGVIAPRSATRGDQLEQFGNGGLAGLLGKIGGVATGIGSFLGPIGAGLGIATSIAGFVGQRRQRKAGEEQQALQQQGQLDAEQAQFDTNQDSYIAQVESNQATNPFTPTFPLGGLLPYNNGDDANAEIEGGEVVRFPNGNLDRPSGPSHAQGGVDINAPENTEIYSAQTKIGENKYGFDPSLTYAEQADIFKKEVDKINEILA